MTRRAPALLALALLACHPGVRLGSPCEYSSECPSPLVCGFGRCRPECAESRDCSLDALCLLDAEGRGTCALPGDPDCRDPGEACAAGLACFAGECVNACETVAECPGGSRCVPSDDGRARCVRDDADAGGGDPDDAAIDGGPACGGPGCDTVVQIAVGRDVSCARTQTGAVWCWGEDAALGDGPGSAESCSTTPCSTRPRRARWVDKFGGEADITGATWLGASARTVCAIVDGGHPICWGRAAEGQTGTGESADTLDVGRRVRDADMELLTDATTLIHGGDVALATRTSVPALVGWGRNARAELGDGTQVERPLAVMLDGVPGASHTVLGAEHGCAIRDAAREVWCYGSNSLGQLGQGTPAIDAFAPAALRAGTLAGADAIAAGDGFSCAIVSGRAWCWGRRETLGVRDGPSACGAYADGTLCSADPIEVTRTAGLAFAEVFAGPTARDVCARAPSGDVWCWGVNAGGVAGDPRGERVLEPRQIRSLTGAAQIAIGAGHGCAIVRGDVLCWGSGEAGQLGRGPTITYDADAAPVAW